MRQGRIGEAVDLLERELAEYPGDPMISYNFAEILWSQKDNGSYRRPVEQLPDFRGQLEMLRQESQQLLPAVLFLLQGQEHIIVKQGLPEPVVEVSRANVLVRQGRIGEAVDLLERELAEYPGDAGCPWRPPPPGSA